MYVTENFLDAVPVITVFTLYSVTLISYRTSYLSHLSWNLKKSIWLLFHVPKNAARMASRVDPDQTLIWIALFHYENMPIQIYWKFYHQKLKIFR